MALPFAVFQEVPEVLLKLTHSPVGSYQAKKSYDVDGSGVKVPLIDCAATGDESKCHAAEAPVISGLQ